MKLTSVLALVACVAPVDAGCVFQRKSPASSHTGVALIDGGARVRTKKPLRTTTSKSVLLNLRGGAGPIQPQILMGILIPFYLVNGAISYLVPEKILETYGVPSDDAFMKLIVMRQGTFVLSITLAALCTQWHRSIVQTAVGVATLPQIIELLRSDLAGEGNKFGYPRLTNLLPAAVAITVAYGCFSTQEWSSTAINGYAAWLILNGIVATLSPSTFTKSWKCDMKIKDITNTSISWFGMLCVSAGIQTAALEWGVDGAAAFGYAFLPTVLYGALQLFNGKIAEISEQSVIGMNFYVILSLVAFVTLSL